MKCPREPPFWTELKFNQCANCPLNSRRAVAALSGGAAHGAGRGALKELVSFDTVGVTVKLQAERTIHAETSGATGHEFGAGADHGHLGMPVDRSLKRPMARFHLPFASETETVYRSVSMYSAGAPLLGAAAADASGVATPG